MRCKERLFVKRTAAFLLAVLMFITLVALMPGRAEAASTTRVVVTGTYMQSDARAMLKRINRFRTGNDAWYYADDSKSEKVKLRNLKKLTYDYTLEKMAMIRAAEAALKFSHTRPNGEDCFSITFLDGMSKGVENIAAGQSTEKEAFVDWCEEDYGYSGQGHRRNMLDEYYTSVGIAAITVGNTTFWVQEFGTPNMGEDETPVVNKKKNVKVELYSGYVYNIKDVKASNISMKVGAKKSIPKIKCSLTLGNETFTRYGGSGSYVSVKAVATAKSSDNSIVSVSGGKLVAEKPGTAKIVLKNRVLGIKRSITVTVTS